MYRRKRVARTGPNRLFQKFVQKDEFQWLMEFKKTAPGDASEVQAEKFKFRCKVDVFSRNGFLFKLQQFKAVKINYVSYYVKAVGFTYSPAYSNTLDPTLHQNQPQITSPSVNAIIGKIPFYILWNHHCDITKDLDIGQMRASMHAKKVFVGGKGAKFVYRVPKNKRAFIDSTYFQTIKPDQPKTNNLGLFLGIFDMAPNAPTVFCGTAGTEISGLSSALYVNDSIPMPFKVMFHVTVKAGVTFSGQNDIVYSFGSREMYNLAGASRNNDEV